jgi:hypothetical protein
MNACPEYHLVRRVPARHEKHAGVAGVTGEVWLMQCEPQWRKTAALLRINEAGVECLGGKDRDHHQRHAHGNKEAHGDDIAIDDIARSS